MLQTAYILRPFMARLVVLTTCMLPLTAHPALRKRELATDGSNQQSTMWTVVHAKSKPPSAFTSIHQDPPEEEEKEEKEDKEEKVEKEEKEGKEEKEEVKADEASPEEAEEVEEEKELSVKEKIYKMGRDLCKKKPDHPKCKVFDKKPEKTEEEETPAPAPPAEEPAEEEEEPTPQPKKLPEQGFEGDKVRHKDMKTQIDDWMDEYDVEQEKKKNEQKPKSSGLRLTASPQAVAIMWTSLAAMCTLLGNR
mmetsp:Transcript_16145/g.27974  ORF Transcript_16145/g.27974 Transcript_16145/m.27974 type:complete len:250 (-) Transcript_16145:16-765(-)